MTINQMLGQSALLTLLGMCVVFSFIIILIGCMKLLQLFVHTAKLDKEKPAETTGSNAAAAPVKDDGAIVAAIVAAVHDKVLNS